MKFLYPFARRFIAGHNFESAKPKIEELMDKGYEVSIDYLGELSETFDDCVRARSQYLEIIEFFKNKKIDISIKPTQLGLSINRHIAYSFVWDIVERAAEYNHTIRLDMEDSAVTTKTIELCLKIKSYFPNIGIALQANLLSTDVEITDLIKKGVSIRLVKGAYKEKPQIAMQEKSQINTAFFDYVARLYSSKANKPAIATHDEELLGEIQELIPNPSYFDYEFLYGVRRDIQNTLKNKGYRVRIYIPFGEDWLPYCLRRLKEFKNLRFVIKNVIKEWFK